MMPKFICACEKEYHGSNCNNPVLTIEGELTTKIIPKSEFKNILNFIKKENPEWLNECNHEFAIVAEDGRPLKATPSMPVRGKCTKCGYMP